MAGLMDEMPELAAVEAAAVGSEGDPLPRALKWGFVALLLGCAIVGILAVVFSHT